MERKNAVEQRLDLLHDQWTEFAQLPGARLLRWVVEPEEVRMVEAFLHREGDDRIGECPDLFLRMEEPFEDPTRYGYALREALVRLEEALRAGAEEEGLPVWNCPEAREGETGAEAFLAACDSLQRHYESLCVHLAVVLMPARGEDASAWREWLRIAVEKPASVHVRLIVLEDAGTQVLEPLAEAFPERVVTIPARLDMGRALEELSRQAGHLDTPGGQFRELFVRLGNAATQGNVGRVEVLGAQAATVATQAGMPSLAVAAYFAMGGALLKAGRLREALERYCQAEAAAKESEALGEPQGARLRLTSLMAQGAVRVNAQELSEAAVLYRQAAPLAHALEDSHMELECWRMASWCCEATQELEPAWAHSQRAWEVGQRLDASTRAASTLPYVGEALVRLSHARQGEHAARAKESEVAEVLGQHWRPRTFAQGGLTS